MKKLFLLALSFVITFAFVSCADDTTTVTTTAAETTVTETTVVTTTAVITTLDTTSAATTTVADAVLAEMYEGSHSVSAMGSDVSYYYSITFAATEYAFHSEFEMGGETYYFDETGTYSVYGNELTLTPDGESAVTGTISDGSVNIAVKASSMATREARNLTEVLVDRTYVGTHTVSAMGSDVVYVYIIKLAHGMYNFCSEFEMGGESYNYLETGTYTVEGTALTLTPEGESAVVGSIGDGEITISIKASSMASRADQTLETSALAINYEGSHTVSAMGSDVLYEYTITFVQGNYEFHSAFTMGDTEYTYDEIGTYSVLGTEITITPDGETAVIGSILPDGTIEVPVKASSMATRGTQVLTETIVQIDA
ncbi:hypothetical protein RJI07_09260 [Mycoplasmatota bacterium WC30]